MRILHVIATMRPGGAERMVTQLATDGVARGDDVVVASAGGSWVPRLEAAGASHVAVPLSGRSPTSVLRLAGHLIPVLRQSRPDVVHSHNVTVTVAARLALSAGGGRRPLLVTVHGLPPADYRQASRLLRLTGGRIVACAPSVARSLATCGLPPDRIEIITNGAALEPAGPDRLDALRVALGLSTRSLVVGLGRLVPQKAWSTLIEAARALPEADVVIAGEGPLRAELEEASRTAGGRVRLVGVVDDPAALLGLADCLVSTSNWEGLPLTLLEALSLGVPTVATAVDGVSDVVPGDAALLVPPGDPAAVASAVRRVLTETGLGQRLAHGARAAARQWRPETMLAAYRQVYEAAAASRAP